MNITTDKETFIDNDEVKRGFANIAPIKVSFQAHPEVNTRIMDAIAKEFKVYQYVDEREGGVPYESGWDFFFWCNTNADRAINYFTLSSHENTPFNKEHNRTIAERENDFVRLREFLETHFADEKCEVCFEWHSEEDAQAILAEAQRTYAELGGGDKWVEYKGEIGKLYYSEQMGYYFKKKGAKKYVWKLTWRGVCNVHQFAHSKAA